MNLKVSKNRLIKNGWTFDLETHCDWLREPKIDISKLTIDEQADLIVKKLSEPPKPKRFDEYEMMLLISRSIADEIDRELLEELKTKGLPK